MKFFLTSVGLSNPKVLADIIGKPLDTIKCVIITNGLDLKSPEKHQKIKDIIGKEFASNGIDYSFLDLRQYSEDNTTNLKKALAKQDMVWVAGGNIFALRQAMRKSGFDQIIKEELEQGLMYGGESAGAMVIGPTLRTFDTVDDPSQDQEVIYDGLKLIDFVPIAHWENPEFQPKLDTIKNSVEQMGYQTIPLQDGESLKIKNGLIEKVGKELLQETEPNGIEN